jgi:hypothetical protein
LRKVIEIMLNNLITSLIVIIILLVIPLFVSYYFPNNVQIKGYKNSLNIFFTNWINIVVIFIVTYISGVISALIVTQLTLIESLFGSVFLVAFYGIMFWIGFIICMFLLDIILFGFNREIKHTKMKLFIEWLIVSLPFIYWLLNIVNGVF